MAGAGVFTLVTFWEHPPSAGSGRTGARRPVRPRGFDADITERKALDRIFDRFQQVDASDARNHGGSGLGLAIAKSIVTRHGGRIWAESELGEGSTFTFELPKNRPAAGDGGRGVGGG